MFNSNSNDLTGIPDNIQQLLIEIVPDHVLSAKPTFIHTKTKKPFPVPPLALDRVNKIIRHAWCFARIHGRAYILADQQDFSVSWGLGSDLQAVAVISNQNSYYMPRLASSRVFSVSTGSTAIQNSMQNGSTWYSQGLIDSAVTEAYCHYNEVVRSSVIRIKNSLQTMVSLFVDPDEDGLVGGVPSTDAMEMLDAQYSQSRRMYGPDGSKLSGISASLDGIDHGIEAMWLALGRAAKIPSWMMTTTESNSSFMLEEREQTLVAYWRQYALEPYYMLMYSLGMPEDVEIVTPDFRTLTHQAMRDDLVSQAEQRRALVELQIKQQKTAEKAAAENPAPAAKQDKQQDPTPKKNKAGQSGGNQSK